MNLGLLPESVWCPPAYCERERSSNRSSRLITMVRLGVVKTARTRGDETADLSEQ